MTPWTHLELTPLWASAQTAHASPGGRHYHGFDHPLAMYAHARTTFGFTHDRILDRAILLHDVIVDGAPEPERRSVDWAIRHGVDDPAVHDMIMRTVSHEPGEDNRLVLLDLADFMFPEAASRNTEALRIEVRELSGTDPEEFRAGCQGYLEGLHDRILAGVHKVPIISDAKAFERIADGVRRTVSRLQHDHIDAPGLS